MTFEIIKNKPIPGNYPFDQMEIGDSFMIPQGVRQQSVAVAATRNSKKTGRKFSIKRTQEGYCCWRVK